MDTRTDRVRYVREIAANADGMLPTATTAAAVTTGSGTLHCHRLLRALALDLEETNCSEFLVPAWTQLASYSDSSGFYRWHKDGLEFPSHYWLLGPLGLVLYFRWGAVRRRAYTAIVYLNKEEEWPEERGGAFRCRVPLDNVVVFRAGPEGLKEEKGKLKTDGTQPGEPVVEIAPSGGRLVLFDSHTLEHEVASTFHERW